MTEHEVGTAVRVEIVLVVTVGGAEFAAKRWAATLPR